MDDQRLIDLSVDFDFVYSIDHTGYLEDLLDNVIRNPYEWIVDSSGFGIINCIDFFFGDTEEKDEVQFAREDSGMMMNDDNDAFIDQIIKQIDKLIEEEEKKEKEETVKINSKKKNKKKSKDRKNGEKSPCDEENKIGRSAEGVELLVDE